MSVRELDENGLLKSSPSTIFTYSGGRIDPLDPHPDDIRIADIAHALSNQCRWTGHTTSFYSVAEHCVHVYDITGRIEGLLHDASEAYLSDLARPIKKAAGLGAAYEEVEERLELAIACRLSLEWPWPEAVKQADEHMLWSEAKLLLPHLGALMPDPPTGTPRPRCWSPVRAENEFLYRYLAYQPT